MSIFCLITCDDGIHLKILIKKKKPQSHGRNVLCVCPAAVCGLSPCLMSDDKHLDFANIITKSTRANSNYHEIIIFPLQHGHDPS